MYWRIQYSQQLTQMYLFALFMLRAELVELLSLSIGLRWYYYTALVRAPVASTSANRAV